MLGRSTKEGMAPGARGEVLIKLSSNKKPKQIYCNQIYPQLEHTDEN